MRQTPTQHGLTLIELMVSMLLATILIGGLFYMMTGQERTYSNQMRALTAQENLWGSMEYLQAEIRKAGTGFSGCSGQMKSNLDASIAGSSVAGVFTAMAVYNNQNLFTGLNDGTDSLSLQYYAVGDFDGGSSSVRVTRGMPNPSAVLWVNNPGALQDNDLIVLCTPGGGWGLVLQLTQAPQQIMGQDNDGDGVADWRLQKNPSSPWNPSGMNNPLWPPNGFGAGSTIVRIGGNPADQFYNFAIDNTRDPPMLVMWQGTNTANRQVVAEGIEDMQISYTCDNGGPGTSNCGGNCQVPGTAPDGEYYEGACTESSGDNTCNCADDDCTARQDDEWVNNVPNDVNPDCSASAIRMVRITLISRTASAVQGDRLGFRPPAEDRMAGTTGTATGTTKISGSNASDDLADTGNIGTYGRAVLTAKVKPRNIRAAN